MLKQYNDFVISVEKTAINRGVSMSCKTVEEMGSTSYKDVLDYGAGKLRNAKHLNSKGFCVDVLDTPLQTSKWRYEDFFEVGFVYDDVNKITKTYDAILCSFVLNVIPDREDRVSILKNIKKLLKDTGIAVIETRSGKDIANSKTAQAYRDGYLMGNGKVKTFQRAINNAELIEMSEEAGLKVVDGYDSSDSSIIALAKQ
ncbi:methyltransferase domain-containing protein [Exiguobacterium sp. s133]|uniref:class I SAM-dependent methyltransferase n=1 Tax=Exiguobacterium sp. s133 TaxID=2751213 RepID=UPI001BE6F306|nr:methyltransferase domain-containing protein [Exiguobacterium sp. s133]